MSVKPDSSPRRRFGLRHELHSVSPSVDGGTTAGESAPRRPAVTPGRVTVRTPAGGHGGVGYSTIVQVLEQQDVGVQDARAIVSVER